MKVLVTGGSGLAGSHVIPVLLEGGHEVISADTQPPQEARGRAQEGEKGFTFVQVDTTDYGQVVATASEAGAIIHLAAIPNPILRPEHEVFRVNMMSSWNVLEAAELHDIGKVVMASSINAIGASFSPFQSREYLPIDEDTPTKSADSYAQSKWLGEQMAEAFCRRRSMQIASLRYHGLWTRERQVEWNSSSGKDLVDDERLARNFWSWADIDEAAEAAVLSIEKDWDGHEAFFIHSNDTIVTVPTEELLQRWYPGVTRKADIPGFESPISNQKAKRMLGWSPMVTWRGT